MSTINRIFLKGLFTLLPISLTIALIVWVITEAESVFAEPLRRQFPQVFGFPGSGVLVAGLMIFLVGLLVNSYLTNRVVAWFEKKLETLPIFRAIYNPIRDVTQLFAHDDKVAQKVVLVKLGDTGLEALGLVTRDRFDDLPRATVPDDSVAVFIPFSFGMGGYTLVVPRSHLREAGIPAERAMQLAITGWIKSSK